MIRVPVKKNVELVILLDFGANFRLFLSVFVVVKMLILSLLSQLTQSNVGVIYFFNYQYQYRFKFYFHSIIYSEKKVHNELNLTSHLIVFIRILYSGE